MNRPDKLQPAARPDAGATTLGVTSADARIGRLAIRSLYREVALAPKPGLVTPLSNGSHRDMTFATFLRSLVALRDYFPAITACGRQQPAFAALQQLGIEAEIAMLAATGGINTHRGAVFNLGLLCAALGSLLHEGLTITAEAICRRVETQWGAKILASSTNLPVELPPSHGQVVARRYGSGGARAEAAAGFPAAREVGLPAYRAVLAVTGDEKRAEMQALFALMAELDDTNMLWRGGPTGLAHGRRAAAEFLAAGGVFASDWRDHAEAIDQDFIARRLSPGGSADLLGVTLFLAELDA
ncbi:MAG: Triphosphoribosyl-dephospho-CoA protein [Proteobacteria bacterium]|nr:Triphosphoribosyl-dephospho-CoA protein [Pseudomonadota bacterium]